ncbi:hypothetical protein BB561_005998 [Smittium simulii]|uniref:Uncharacterized protein n=1 Tax=Smittium simulii TaxID=133385 RepID=A0A2T9Y752_9FUNG|nr:hypothetical protein BB561_005998 [Smittium simulii]
MPFNDSFMYDNDEYDFEFEDQGEEYNSQDSEQVPNAQLQSENAYYSAKANIPTDPLAAIKQFEELVILDDQKSEW